ncbi:MAG: sigma-70 family RNA polymerase sigma factor [Eubacteriales bacterium]|nr:sigma-70 family RNA polymerase sigma factor [Eubacteriales bacterium]MDY4898525.1 sigma-70 family RNA polymerase sigma factor [Eubacteriales bacterium]
MDKRSPEQAIATGDMNNILKQYGYGLKMLKMNKYEKDFFGGSAPEDGLFCTDDEAYIKARMFEIKRFVTSLPPDDRKMFLYYHYIRGETVERCGELLGISRRSAFRLKARALEYAAVKYRRFAPPPPEE